MGRFGRSWEIAKSSARVLQADKELVVLPLFGFLFTVAILALWGAAAWFSLEETVDLTGTTTYEPSGLTYAIGLVGYLCTTFVGVFFTAALVSGAHERLNGGNPSVGSALGGAARRFPQILGWAVVATTVGLVLQFIADRGIIGRIVAGMLSFAWQVLTFLAVPVIIVEGPGPFASLKRCGELFRQTWGENLIAQVGFGLLGFVAVLPGLALAFGLGAVVPIAGIVLGVAWIAVVSLILSALNGIYRAALYQYATTGQVPPGFPPEAMQYAFAPKTGASRFLG